MCIDGLGKACWIVWALWHHQHFFGKANKSTYFGEPQFHDITGHCCGLHLHAGLDIPYDCSFSCRVVLVHLGEHVLPVRGHTWWMVTPCCELCNDLQTTRDALVFFSKTYVAFFRAQLYHMHLQLWRQWPVRVNDCLSLGKKQNFTFAQTVSPPG